MQILKLKGFLFEPSDPAIYDRDSKTVLELCGRLGYKINELIDEYNRFYEEMNENYREAYDYMVTNLPLFVAEQLPVIAPGVMEELWGEDIEGLLQDMADLKAEYTYYEGFNDLKTNGDKAPVGAYLRTLYRSAPDDKGGALYEVVDHLEEGEVANDEDIIALGVTLEPTKWAKMVPGKIVHSTSFLSLQSAINYAYKHWLDVLVCELCQVDGDLTIPYNVDTPVRRVRIIGLHNQTTGIQINGHINLGTGADFVNYSLENLYLEETSLESNNLLGELVLGELEGETIVFVKDCRIVNSYLSIINGTGLAVVNNAFYNSCLLFVTSRNCKAIYNNFIHDEYTRIGNCLACSSCFSLLFENNTYATYGNDMCVTMTQTSNSSMQNENFDMMNVTQQLVTMDTCHYNNFSNIYIGGVYTFTKIFYLTGCNENTFTGIKARYTNNNPTGSLFNLVGCDYNYFDDIELCDKTGFLITNASANNFIRNYHAFYNSPTINIVESVSASDNSIELAVDTDVERLHASNNQPIIKFTIPSEIKYGDNATMDLLYDYDGRIYYR